MPGCLVSSDQEDFTYYENEYNEKMMFLYTRDLGCLLRIRPLGWNPGGGGGGAITLEISSQNALTVMTCM